MTTVTIATTIKTQPVSRAYALGGLCRAVGVLPTHLRLVGLLLQTDIRLAHLSELKNLLFAALTGAQAARLAQAHAALTEIELPEFAHADPATLSGG